MRILLTEDGMLIGDGIKTGLNKVGFSVDWSTRGHQRKETLCSAPYDAAILGLTLPGMNGRDISHEWRRKDQRGPILTLTARDALEERIEGLRLGASDYLCKPLALIGAATRLEALTYRTNGQANNELRHSNIMLDPGKHVATLASEPLMLKPKEFVLPGLLVRNTGRVSPCKPIEEKLYTWDEKVTSNATEIHVHHLWHKPGSDFIRIIHGIDYALGEK